MLLHSHFNACRSAYKAVVICAARSFFNSPLASTSHWATTLQDWDEGSPADAPRLPACSGFTVENRTISASAALQ